NVVIGRDDVINAKHSTDDTLLALDRKTATTLPVRNLLPISTLDSPLPLKVAVTRNGSKTIETNQPQVKGGAPSLPGLFYKGPAVDVPASRFVFGDDIGTSATPSPNDATVSQPMTDTPGSHLVLAGGNGGTVNVTSNGIVAVNSTIKVSASALPGRASNSGGSGATTQPVGLAPGN
ncbi:MAG TPA: hypothetical protein VNW28_00640, partial [Chthoniobacterales bacterium]|nr:hypothetical protein [Chthoniobacterales bacterium]